MLLERLRNYEHYGTPPDDFSNNYLVYSCSWLSCVLQSLCQLLKVDKAGVQRMQAVVLQ